MIASSQKEKSDGLLRLLNSEDTARPFQALDPLMTRPTSNGLSLSKLLVDVDTPIHQSLKTMPLQKPSEGSGVGYPYASLKKKISNGLKRILSLIMPQLHSPGRHSGISLLDTLTITTKPGWESHTRKRMKWKFTPGRSRSISPCWKSLKKGCS